MEELNLFKLSDLNIGSRILHFENLGSTTISVSENDNYRWMTIDDAVQTVQCKQQPHRPLLPHLNALLLVLCYQPSPQNILELGLGGGSLPRFFNYHFPRSKIISIENNPAVVSQFNKWFSDSLTTHDIVIADASQKISAYKQQDLIVVDLFSKNGSPDFVSTLPFYQDCVNALSTSGVLAINFIAQYQLQFDMTLDLLRQLNLHIRTFSVPGYQNKIVMAARQDLPFLQYDESLNQFAQQYQLDLNQIVAMS